MAIAQSNELTPRKPLRLWPAVAIALVQLLVGFGAPLVAPDAGPIGMLAGVVAALAIAVWWLLFSRAPWFERVGAIVLMIVGVLAAKAVAHESIVGAGQGMLMYILPTPYLALALVAWAVATRHLRDGIRRASLVAAVLLVCAPFALIRTSGIKGGAGSEFHWRWTPTPEQLLLAQGGDEPKPLLPSAAPASSAAPAETAKETPAARASVTPAAVPAAPAEKIESAAKTVTDTPAEWPGFRGPGRDSVVRGVRIETDWTKSPPAVIWRRPIGPGWSSFAVRGDLLYTQEQRGEDEVVSSYKVSTGEPVWRHRDAARFYESNGGPGPRATPTLSGGRVYAFGATGILNALDAGNGAVVWSRNAATDTGVEIPGWGFAGSPLVVNDVVIVAASGRLAAYDAATGHPRWYGPTGGGGYSSPHLATIDGVPQVLLLRGSRTISVAPGDGTLLWEHTWLLGASIVQPALIAGGDLLINSVDAMGGNGIRRLAVARGAAGWTVEERWTSRGLKPYFNDLVVHKGHAFGFDGSILSAVDLADGTRKWKGGRYGNGQMVLLADQDLLLVLSEDGELALVSATGDQFTEVARIPALNSKTWNHPVVVGDILLIRNGEEMAAFRLPLAGREVQTSR